MPHSVINSPVKSFVVSSFMGVVFQYYLDLLCRGSPSISFSVLDHLSLFDFVFCFLNSSCMSAWFARLGLIILLPSMICGGLKFKSVSMGLVHLFCLCQFLLGLIFFLFDLFRFFFFLKWMIYLDLLNLWQSHLIYFSSFMNFINAIHCR